MSDLAQVLAENHKEMLKMIALRSNKRPVCLEDQNSDSEPENASVAGTSTPVKSIATNSRTTSVNSRNSGFMKLL